MQLDMEYKALAKEMSDRVGFTLKIFLACMLSEKEIMLSLRSFNLQFTVFSQENQRCPTQLKNI